jgi:hypothetical protein
VSQISPPIRILVVLSVALLGMYMLFLRPKAEVVPPAEPAPNVQTSEPAVSEPGKVGEAAQNAVDASNDQLSAQESVDGVDAGESGATPSGSGGKAAPPSDDDDAAADAATAEELKGLPTPVRRALRKDKVLVLLFWNGKSADDKAVRAGLKKVDRWNGRVSVQVAPIKQIAKYGRIARGVNVDQSPTIVITDPEMRAETLVGYVDTTTIDQVVVDAFRNTTGLFKDAYLRRVNGVCTRNGKAFATIPNADGSIETLREVGTIFSQLDTRWAKWAADFKAIKAPKKWRAFKSATVADNAAMATWLSGLADYLGPKPSLSRLRSALPRFDNPSLDARGKRFNKRMDSKHLTLCGSQA